MADDIWLYGSLLKVHWSRCSTSIVLLASKLRAIQYWNFAIHQHPVPWDRVWLSLATDCPIQLWCYGLRLVSSTRDIVSTASLDVPYPNVVEHGQSQTDIDQAVLSVLHSGQFIAGPYRSLCEKAVSKLVGLPFAVGVGSGTSALKMALQALGVGPGDEVILPAISFVATFESIAQTGATPEVVDVQSNRPLISSEK